MVWNSRVYSRMVQQPEQRRLQYLDAWETYLDCQVLGVMGTGICICYMAILSGLTKSTEHPSTTATKEEICVM